MIYVLSVLNLVLIATLIRSKETITKLKKEVERERSNNRQRRRYQARRVK